MQEKALNNFFYYIFMEVSLAYTHLLLFTCTEMPQSPT